ncbi:hypothetical protein L917_10047 [Phytophthora nicotianae]|uniref:Transmembrane protein 198 n=2 Tax=Phytophthora nicotianae TaxID=4792 RepID=W2L3J1_PHYNI|nr:hypothetical protein L917_10047 [Phytophthora nicotianae]
MPGGPTPRSFVTLMLLQLSLKFSIVSADVDSASDNVESLFGKAQGIQLEGSILASTAIIVGAVMLTFGFRLVRPALFVVGFVVGGVTIAMITERLFSDEPWVVLASWIAFGVGGVLCGAAVIWVYPVSTFAVGAATGVMTGMIITISLGYLIYPGHSKDLITLLCVVLGFVFGVLALKLGKPLLIISTSLFGSGMVAWGVGYFAGDFPDANDLEQYESEDINGDTVYSIPPAWWGYLAGIIVLFVFGMFIQFRKTARNGKDNRPKSRRVDVAEYVETKTARNQSQDSVDMEVTPRHVRPQREVREKRRVRRVLLQQTPNQQRIKKQQAPPSSLYSTTPRYQYADLDATGEIIEYDERIPHQKRVFSSNREPDLYELEPSRGPCAICGDHGHRDSSICSEKVIRIERH